MRNRLDSFVEWLARTVSWIFFRRIEVVGEEQIPRGVPLLLVANHHNSLIDPVLILGTLESRPRFLAKSTLWQVPGLRQLLDLGGVIPVYRKQDEGEDTAKNQDTFERCFEALGAGGAVALFPEGISHNAPHLAGLKTGAARIALGTLERFGREDLRIVPVGLTFDEKGTFRSRALVQVGAPIDPGDWAPAPSPDGAADPDASRDAVRALTAEIDERLREVTLNYPSHEHAVLIEKAAEVWQREGMELPERWALAEAFTVRRAFIEGTERVRQAVPERVAAAERQLERYVEKLGQLKIRDEHVAARYPSEEVSLIALGTASLLLFWLPLAFVGTVLNFVPYRLTGVLARFGRTPDLPATLKLFSGFLLFPLTWALEAGLAWAAWGGLAALATAVAAPITGFFAMRFHERHERAWEELGSYLTLKLRPGRAAEIRAERDAVRKTVRELAEHPARDDGASDE